MGDESEPAAKTATSVQLLMRRGGGNRSKFLSLLLLLTSKRRAHQTPSYSFPFLTLRAELNPNHSHGRNPSGFKPASQTSFWLGAWLAVATGRHTYYFCAF